MNVGLFWKECILKRRRRQNTPRLRYLKKFEQISENNNGQDTERIQEYAESEQGELSGQSWWSNSNIITSLSESKIKQAITYHKQMVKTLENELCARVVGTREYNPYIPSCSSRDIYPNTRQAFRPILQPVWTALKHIRKKHGQVAFEKCKEEWKVILQNSNKGA